MNGIIFNILGETISLAVSKISSVTVVSFCKLRDSRMLFAIVVSGPSVGYGTGCFKSKKNKDEAIQNEVITM